MNKYYKFLTEYNYEIRGNIIQSSKKTARKR